MSLREEMCLLVLLMSDIPRRNPISQRNTPSQIEAIRFQIDRIKGEIKINLARDIHVIEYASNIVKSR